MNQTPSELSQEYVPLVRLSGELTERGRDLRVDPLTLVRAGLATLPPPWIHAPTRLEGKRARGGY